MWKFELFEKDATEPYHSTYERSPQNLPLFVQAALDIGRADRIVIEKMPDVATG